MQIRQFDSFIYPYTALALVVGAFFMSNILYFYIAIYGNV